MNYKYLLIGIIFLFSISFVNAEDNICLNPVLANTTCQMTTPVITCPSYTYEVYNDNSSLIDSGLMTQFINSTYYFNFTQDVGTYYIKICDGSTRQIIVMSGDTMIGFTTETWVYVIVFLMFVLFLYLSFKIAPLFLTLNGIIMMWFAYDTYNTLQTYPITIMLALVGLIFIFFGVIGQIYKK